MGGVEQGYSKHELKWSEGCSEGGVRVVVRVE
jgi:hypothetical protein